MEARRKRDTAGRQPPPNCSEKAASRKAKSLSSSSFITTGFRFNRDCSRVCRRSALFCTKQLAERESEKASREKALSMV